MIKCLWIVDLPRVTCDLSSVDKVVIRDRDLDISVEIPVCEAHNAAYKQRAAAKRNKTTRKV